MKYAIALILLTGCASQSSQAFHVRPAAEETPPAGPNHSAEHNAALRQCVDTMTQAHEAIDQGPYGAAR